MSSLEITLSSDTTPEKLIKELGPAKEPISLILDNTYIKQFQFHIEDTSGNNLMPLIKAQLANNVDIPEELLSCQIVDMKEDNDKVQGLLLYANDLELKELLRLFKKAHLKILNITAIGFPKFFFYDSTQETRQKNKILKHALAFSSLILILSSSISFGNSILANKLSEFSKIKTLYLINEQKNKKLENYQRALEAADHLLANSKKQRNLLNDFFRSFPGTLPGGLSPQQIDLDLTNNSFAINGTCQDISKSNYFIKKLAELPFIENVCLEKLEAASTGLKFDLTGAL